jgi:hypothetical protein
MRVMEAESSSAVRFEISAAGVGVEAHGGGGDLGVALEFVVEFGSNVFGPIFKGWQAEGPVVDAD